jgi:hypothetical protein
MEACEAIRARQATWGQRSMRKRDRTDYRKKYYQENREKLLEKARQRRADPDSLSLEAQRRLFLLHERGICRPHSEAKEHSMYLGIHLGLQIAEKYYPNAMRSRCFSGQGYPGYDLACKDGHRIEVHCSCRRKNKRESSMVYGSDYWAFSIKKNKVPDYFFLIAFNTRDNPLVEHVWLIPAIAINMKTHFGISESKLEKWHAYELSSGKANAFMMHMPRAEVKA